MILVTGATGLVGAHLLAKLLRTEGCVKALYRSESRKNITKRIITYYYPENVALFFSKIIWVRTDLTDIPSLTDAFQEVSRVYHCAGLISYDPSDYRILQKTNVEGTANIVNLCLAFQVEKLCYVSSIATLGKELGDKPITENSNFEHDGKHSNYALTKFGAEMEVWRGSQEGLNVVIVNPGVIIGPGNWNKGSGLLFKKTYHGLSYYFPKITGFVAVEDVVEIMIRLMQKRVKNERYILVSENISFEHVLSEIAKSLQKPVPRKELKSWMIFLGWIFQWFAGLFGAKRQITKHSIKGLFGKSIYDSSKIKAALDFRFRPVDKTVQKTAVVFLNEHKENRSA